MRLAQRPKDIRGIGRSNGCVLYEAEGTTDDLNISHFTKIMQKIGYLAPYEISKGNMIPNTFEKSTINTTYRPLFYKCDK
jgi:hypothetical protein